MRLVEHSLQSFLRGKKKDKSDPFALQSCSQQTSNMLHVTCQTITPDYLQGYFLEAGQGGRGKVPL